MMMISEDFPIRCITQWNHWGQMSHYSRRSWRLCACVTYPPWWDICRRNAVDRRVAVVLMCMATRRGCLRHRQSDRHIIA